MIEQNICFVVVYLAEALTAWQFFGGVILSPAADMGSRHIVRGRLWIGLVVLCFEFCACECLDICGMYRAHSLHRIYGRNRESCSIRGIVVCAYAGYRIPVNAVSWGFF